MNTTTETEDTTEIAEGTFRVRCWELGFRVLPAGTTEIEAVRFFTRNAYVSVRRCLVTRSGAAASPAGTLTLTPRLRAECQIDLITVLDAGAKA